MLTYDRSWANDSLKEIMKRLFKSERNRLGKNILSIIKENQKLMGSIDGFYYQGRLFSELDSNIQAHGTRGNLASALVPKMEAYLLDERKIDYEEGRIKQALGLLIIDCKDMQDIRDSFPDCMVDVVSEIAHLPRTREEAYNLLEKPRQYKQYMKLKPLIEMYVVSKLFY